MKNIILPVTRTKELYKVEPQEGEILFDPMSIVGHSEKTSLRPNDWSYINNLENPKTTIYQSKDPAFFVDINRIMNDPSLSPHKENLINVALEEGLLLHTAYYAVQWKDGDNDYGPTYHISFAEALNAANGLEDLISKKEGIIGTRKLAEAIGITEQLIMTNPLTYGVIGVLQSYSDKGLNINGIFWSEEYSCNEHMSEIISIFPNKANSWETSMVEKPVSDFELIARKSDTSHEMFSLPKQRHQNENIVSFSI